MNNIKRKLDNIGTSSSPSSSEPQQKVSRTEGQRPFVSRRIFSINRHSLETDVSCLVLRVGEYTKRSEDPSDRRVKRCSVLTVFQPPSDDQIRGEPFVYTIFVDGFLGTPRCFEISPMHVYNMRGCKKFGLSVYTIDMSKPFNYIEESGDLSSRPEYDPSTYNWKELSQLVSEPQERVGCVQADVVSVDQPHFSKKVFVGRALFSDGNVQQTISCFFNDLEENWAKMRPGDRVLLFDVKREVRKDSDGSERRSYSAQQVMIVLSGDGFVPQMDPAKEPVVGEHEGTPLKASQINDCSVLLTMKPYTEFKRYLEDVRIERILGPYSRRCGKCSELVPKNENASHRCDRYCRSCSSFISSALWNQHDCNDKRADTSFLSVVFSTKDSGDMCMNWYNYKIPALMDSRFDVLPVENQQSLMESLKDRIKGLVFKIYPTRGGIGSSICIDGIELKD